MTELLTRPDTPVPRDDKKRPLIKPVGQLNAKPIAYTRCTTYIECLDSTYALEKWKMRMAALGIAERDDLRLSVLAHRDDRDVLNKLAWEATEAARASAKATEGTAWHTFTEKIDRGEEVGRVPGEVADKLNEYREVTQHFETLAVERFVVQDTLKIGGTPDRIYRYGRRSYIGDVKSGAGALTYGQRSIAMQLAVYARSKLYDPRTGHRSDLPDDLDPTRGIIVHMPAGEPIQWQWVDLTAGWHAVVTLAQKVRAWRNRKDLIVPNVPNTLEQAIWSAPTQAELYAVWEANQDRWTDAHTKLATERKSELVGY